MSLQPLPQRVLVTHAPPDAFAPMTRVILAKLGYAILDEDEFEHTAKSLARDRPDLRIVDERQLAEVPDELDVPILVLCGRHGVTGADSRIVGAVRRPAGLHEIYRLIQLVLEDMPRASPRVPTHLPARCVSPERPDREWRAAVLSLSENGCLLRSPVPLLLGSRLEVHFELPRVGVLDLDAEIAYQLIPDVGLIFNGTLPDQRSALSSYVAQALAAG